MDDIRDDARDDARDGTRDDARDAGENFSVRGSGGSLLVLASASPRRRMLMRQVGVDCAIMSVDADETLENGLTPDEAVVAIARRKALGALDALGALGALDALDALDALAQYGGCGSVIFIAADTLVCVDGRILGKPRDAADAFAMLEGLQGRCHTVYTGVALIKAKDGSAVAEQTFVEEATVHMRSLTAAEINAYVATGEPLDKAGAYGAQEKGALLVTRVEGDFHTVVGLPLARLCVALRVWGVDLLTPTATVAAATTVVELETEPKPKSVSKSKSVSMA